MTETVKTFNTADELAAELGRVFNDLRNGGITYKEADSFANLAGKINRLHEGQQKEMERLQVQTMTPFYSVRAA